MLLAATLQGCGAGAPPGRASADTSVAALSGDRLAALSDSSFAALVARISEPGGHFDTDNLISNESAYLKVVGALERRGVRGGAYVGVGPDQNYSYIARIRPEIAFLVDIRRDNLLHHLMLRALLERAPTRVEFLAGLHGRAPPPDPEAWRARPIDEIVDWLDARPADPELVEELQREIAGAVDGFGVPLSEEDHATIRRFHRTFVEAGPDLRFTSHGRPPRAVYPTYRQLVLETDMDGRRASYLSAPDLYAFVRGLALSGRMVPVVGDLAGPHALREIGRVLEERGLPLTAFYASNVEFYLWSAGSFGAWLENLRAIPAADQAVVIRSYFPNSGRTHPSAVPGHYPAQTLQPVSTIVAGGFADYWDVVTRGVLPLRE